MFFGFFWGSGKRGGEREEREESKKKKNPTLITTHIRISMSGSSLIDSAASSEFSTSSRIDV